MLQVGAAFAGFRLGAALCRASRDVAARRVTVAAGLLGLAVWPVAWERISVVGSLPEGFPSLAFPTVAWDDMMPLTLAAVGIALVAFDQVVPEPGRACFLAAPKGQGDMLLAAHEKGGGVPGLLAVTDGSPPETWVMSRSASFSVSVSASAVVMAS